MKRFYDQQHYVLVMETRNVENYAEKILVKPVVVDCLIIQF